MQLSAIAFALPWSQSSSKPTENASTASQIAFVKFPLKTSSDELGEWTRLVFVNFHIMPNIVLQIILEEDTCTYVRFSWHILISCRNVIGQVMESETRKICYNSQEIINSLQRIHEYDSQRGIKNMRFQAYQKSSFNTIWLFYTPSPPCNVTSCNIG